MADAVQRQDIIVRFESVEKRFGGALALAGANLAVRRGTIHGIVGQNGAGKSTLIKLLAGLYQADAGRVEIDGVVHDRLTPHLVEALGIHFIHQDRLLVPTFTVGEALFVGREKRIPGTLFLDRSGMQRKAAEYLDRYFGIRLPPSALVAELTAAEKQIVQITRALIAEPKILVFDEPTATLVRREAELLFSLIRRLRDQGITIVYISHYLGEIVDLCDAVTVLRNGKDVATLAVEDTSAVEIGQLMVDRDIGDLYPKPVVEKGEVLLSVTGLGLGGRYDGVSFDVRRGEVLGLTGLVGSGAKDVVRTLFGLDTTTHGRIEAAGERLSAKSPAEAARRQLALVPEDRRKDGVALALSVLENTTLASLDRFSRGVIDRRAERAATTDLIDRLQIKTDGADALVSTLSGGNQQEVAIAKWLSRQSEIYLLDEPTVGVDIGAKVEIYRLIGELAERGAAVIVLSTDLEELLGITDRILVFFRGRISRQFVSSETTPGDVLAEVTGAHETLRHAV